MYRMCTPIDRDTKISITATLHSYRSGHYLFHVHRRVANGAVNVGETTWQGMMKRITGLTIVAGNSRDCSSLKRRKDRERIGVRIEIGLGSIGDMRAPTNLFVHSSPYGQCQRVHSFGSDVENRAFTDIDNEENDGESACCVSALRAVRRRRMLAARRSLLH